MIRTTRDLVLAMNSVNQVKKLLESGILLPELTIVPARGATQEEIAEIEKLMGRELSLSLKQFLSSWDGIDIEVIRILSCGTSSHRLQRMADWQRLLPEIADGGVVFGSDPAGFTYIELPGGRIASSDSDGGMFRILASDFEDFICRLVLGPDAAEFAGEEWEAELKDAGFF